MTAFKFPSFTAISHFDNYSCEMQARLIRRTMDKFQETAKSVLWGRMAAIIAAFVFTPLWFALCITCTLTIILMVQKSTLEYISDELNTGQNSTAPLLNSLSILGFVRSCVFGLLFVGLSLSENRLGASTACFFVAGHAYLFASQYIVLPKSTAIGLSPLMVAVILVIGLQLRDGGTLGLILAPGFFVVSTAIIINRISLGALKLLDLHTQFEATAQTAEANLLALRNEAALREETELTAGVGSYEWYLENDSHVWSRGAYSIYGRQVVDGIPTVEEFVARIIDADRNTFVAKMRKAKETGKSIGHEFSIMGFDGQLRHIKSQGDAIRDEQGKVIGFRGMVIDQTAQKTTAKTLQENLAALKKEAALREELELTAGVGSYEWYFEDNRHVWSKGTYDIYGRAYEDGIPGYEDFASRLEETGREAVMKKIEMTRIDGVWDGSEYQFKGYDGVDRHIKCYGNPIKNTKGKVIGMRGLVVDNTQEKRTSEKIAESQMLLNMALIQGKSVVFVDDLAARNMQAYGAIDFIGLKTDEDSMLTRRALFDRIPNDDKKIVFGAIKQAEDSGKIAVVEHRIMSAKDELTEVRLSLKTEGKPSTGHGRVISISTSIEDEVRRRNELSDALDEARRLSRVKSEFLANMSHEIRTPLNGIIAVAGILSNTKLDKKQKEMLHLVENSGETLCRILNDILDIARVESGKLEIANSVFNLQESLENVCTLFEAKASEKGIAVTSSFAPSANSAFIGDSVRIRQIVSNLMSNAVKFTKKGSVNFALNIEAAEGDNKICRIEVTDTGSGLRPKDIARLFDRFEQVDGSITRQHGGSGLGLSISRSLAQLMGGDIAVKSEYGVGSTFTLTVPLQATQQPAQIKAEQTSETPPTTRSEGTISILGVDDNITNRKVMEMILGQVGVNLTLCENGQEAIDIFGQENFDLILMDLQMPVLDGLSAIREIRKLENNGDVAVTPIVAVSANAMSHHIKEAIDAGADDFLAKPFTPTALMTMVEKAINAKGKAKEKPPSKKAKKA